MSKEILKDWTTQVGLRAVMLKVHNSHLCGYVAVGPEHILFGKSYNDEVPELQTALEQLKLKPADEVLKHAGAMTMLAAIVGEFKPTPCMVIRVHGDLTYSGGSGSYPVPALNLWWFGFDQNHYQDEARGRKLDELYCIDQCELLAFQLTALPLTTPNKD